MYARGGVWVTLFLLRQWFREGRVIRAAAALEYTRARAQFLRACGQGMMSVSANSACCKLEHVDSRWARGNASDCGGGTGL